MATSTVKVELSMLMEITMKETGKTMLFLEQVLITMLKDKHTQVTGKKMSKKVKELKLG